MPPNATHPTPRGLRAIYVLGEGISDPALFRRASQGGAPLLQEALADLLATDGASGLSVDPACEGDLARLYWTPKASVNGDVRRGELQTIRPRPYDLAELPLPDPDLGAEGGGSRAPLAFRQRPPSPRR